MSKMILSKDPIRSENNGSDTPIGETDLATTAESDSAIDEMMQRVKEHHDAGIVFDFIPDLAQLSKAEYAKVKIQLKRILDRSLNLRDLDGAVKEEREAIKRSNSEKHLYENGLSVIVIDNQHLRDVSSLGLAFYDSYCF